MTCTCLGGYFADGVNNTVENNLFYRVDIGYRPNTMNWSDAGIDSGAAESGPDARSSFHYQRNVLVIDSGLMFAGSTSNGYRNMSFSNNVYWDLSKPSPEWVSFPCDPDNVNFTLALFCVRVLCHPYGAHCVA